MIRVGESLTRAEMRWRAAQTEEAGHVPTAWEWAREVNEAGTFDELLALGGIDMTANRPSRRAPAKR